MYKLIILFIFTMFSSLANAQNIYSAVHLNEQRDYKTKKPIKIVETNIFYNSSGKSLEKNIKNFDDSGMLLQEERYDDNEKLTAKLTYTNDTVNKLVLGRSLERWTKLGYSKETAFYVYDSTKSLTQVIDKDNNGNLIRLSKIICNDKKLPIELSLFDEEGKLYGTETATYLYDRNKIVTSIVAASGKIVSTDTITMSFKNASQFAGPNEKYNENGDALNWMSKNPNGTATIYEEEYLYDSFGNCTESKVYKVTAKANGKQKRQIERVYKREYSY